MEEEFIVKRGLEGNVKITSDCETICNTMGCQSFNDRYLGSVAAVVEMEAGIITRQRLNWGVDNDPNFNRAQQKNADALLAAVVKAVQAGGVDPADMKIKLIVKK
jgi:hypothetical protein